MNEHEFEQHLKGMLDQIGFTDEVDVPPELANADSGIVSVSSFSEAGVLSNNAGLFIRMRDGREFYLTIVAGR